MSTWRSQANPNPRKTTSIQPPRVSIPNKGTPQPTIETPSSTTTTAPMNAMPANPTLATTPRSSNLVLNQVENPAIEDFGRDKDLKNLLKKPQPKAFIGEEIMSPRSSKNGS